MRETVSLEYELIDIEFCNDYSCSDEQMFVVREDEPVEDKVLKEDGKRILEYDAVGIPMGDSLCEIEKRESIINDFFTRWSAGNTERKVYNEILQEYIYVRAVSVIEAKEHSAKSYKSTCAIMIIDEVLKNASPIRRVPKKENNKNQKDFDHMLVMIYKHADIGTIKLTLGVRRNSLKIQYGLTALRPDQPLIDESIIRSGRSRKQRNAGHIK